MAIGIDDTLAAAAAGIKLTNTVVETVKAYRKKSGDIDIELLIEEVRVTALKRIDEADTALMQLESTLANKGVDLDKTLREVIDATPWWKPFEYHRLKNIRYGFDALATAAYGACDDIAALVKCRDRSGPMGSAAVDSTVAKHELSAKLLEAKSIAIAIKILRDELKRQKKALD